MELGARECGNFQSFFQCWIVQQSQHLDELVSALRHHGKNGRVLGELVGRVIRHYEYYYGAKSKWAKLDVLSMFNPPWISSLEHAFLWIGGWRPSMAFHLLYSKSGLQLEARIEEVMQGTQRGDLADLSAYQLERVDDMQRRTIEEEKEIAEKLAKQQEALADASMVNLSHAATELMREVGAAAGGDRAEVALAVKEEGLLKILKRADGLRVKTLKGILDVLTTVQSVHFLIAAAELHLRVHEWGRKRHPRSLNLGDIGQGC